MKNKLGLALIGLVVIGTVAYIVFNKLGGNTPIEISLIKKSPEPLSGFYYVGTPQDERLSEAFQEMEKQKNLHPGTFLHTIYEVEPAGKLDTMRVFVGINQALSGEEIETRIFREQSFLLAKIQANRWVMPGPEKVKERIREFADSAQISLSEVFIDKIIAENEVHVIAPVKD
ncbi:hypothetical protein [Algoriphagus formosus]|uniref:GyrI-like small molecule binding domain-containing protein n=1 Tax=Algoriphagus formosus TaxID=2007308 RepID=A0A4R5VCX8_9BACT|nr:MULTISPECIES: hypothetical protein [Algoriphagus]TDK49964.1 hypothetical protein E1898_02265 [Algoriphagus aquimaris]